MKNFLHYIVALCLGALFLTSCKKNSQSDGITTNSSSSMTFKVDGTVHTSIATAAYFGDASNRSVIITGNNNDATAMLNIAINIQGLKTGTYDVITGNGPNSYISQLLYSVGKNLSDNYYAQTGQVVITSVTDKNVSGTFQFSGKNTDATTPQTKSITEGKFSCDVTGTH